jgi:hypothetical protein
MLPALGRWKKKDGCPRPAWAKGRDPSENKPKVLGDLTQVVGHLVWGGSHAYICNKSGGLITNQQELLKKLR